MEFSLSIASFIAIAVVFVAIPGPNIAVIVATTLTSGASRGLATVAGTSLAMAIQLLVAAMATNWLLALIMEKLAWLKWLGVIYLAYVGLYSLHRFLNHDLKNSPAIASGELASFQRGFWVSLTNPKTILFFSAFLPQFVTSQEVYLQQIALLSLLFWLIAVIIDSGYVLLAAYIRNPFSNLNIVKYQQGISGALFLLASGALALSHKS